jgi:hypothetical protein
MSASNPSEFNFSGNIDQHKGFAIDSEFLYVDDISIHKFEVDGIQYHDVPDPVPEGEKPYDHQWTLNDIGDEVEHTSNAVFNLGDSVNEILQTVTQIQVDTRRNAASAPVIKDIPRDIPRDTNAPAAATDEYTKYDYVHQANVPSNHQIRQTLSLLSADVKSLKVSIESIMSKLDSLSTQKEPSRDTDRLLSQLISRFEIFAVTSISFLE